MYTGFALLQEEICQPILHSFLEALTENDHLPSSKPVPLKQAFISYAWPPNPVDCTALQCTLVRLVKDLSKARIKVLLDIQHLTLGVDINKFMENGIKTSDYILLIGTPRLKDRITFLPDGSPANNATVEFMHISNKVKSHPSCLLPLWFYGTTSIDAFPSHPIIERRQLYDFRNESDYYHQISLVAVAILDAPPTSKELGQFQLKVREQQALMTDDAILKCLALEEKALQRKREAAEAEIQRLLKNVNVQYCREQASVKEAHQRALKNRIESIYQQSFLLQSDTLSYYIPLQGAMKIDAPPSLCFDVLQKVQEFLDNRNDARVLLILAPAGAGKTTFAHFLELRLWQQYFSNQEKALPFFISLSHISNPFHNIISALLGRGFTSEDIARLKEKQTVFILDSLDELAAESTPKCGLLESNGFLQWRKAKFILPCRPEYLSNLSLQLGTPYSSHFNQQQCGLREFFLMPFNDAQVGYSLSPFLWF